MTRIFALAIAALALVACVPSEKDLRPLSTTTGGYDAPASTQAAAPAYTPRASDFYISVVELEKKCYGSAGCSVTYMIDPSYTGQALSSDQTYRVIYDLSGGDDPETGSFSVRGGQYTKSGEERISTPDSSAVLTATVSRVIAD